MSGFTHLSIEPRRAVRPIRKTAKLAWLFAGCVTVAVAGCSKGPERLPVSPVTGQLTFKGKPAEGALVVFHPAANSPAKDLRPVGQVGADGSFTVTTYAKDDGAPEGDYNVTVVWFKTIKKGKSGDQENGPSQVPAAFTKPTSTTLKAKIVSSGANQLPAFELTGDAAPISTASRPIVNQGE